jgi:hypothetical protein
MLQLSEIWIYPIKSLGGIKLQQAQVTDRGLEHDRRWLLVDENGLFQSQREHPEMALFQTEIEGDFLSVTHRFKEDKIQIPLLQSFSENQKRIPVTVWDDTIEAYEVSKAANDWFTKMLGLKVKLVYMPENSHRKVSPKYAITGNEINSFSDGYPFLVIGQASLEDLNSRLTTAVPMNRFRPNFVFTGGKPYEEETWKEIKIGAVSFFGVKPCGRCVVITIDQESGKKSEKDPLLTLSKYRKVGNKVLFGQNLLGVENGSLNVGDEVKLLSSNQS